MKKLWLLGGTTEGRMLAEKFSALNIPTILTVASEYGKEVVGPLPEVEIRVGRLDRESMTEMVEQDRPFLIIDATHPYAEEVSRNTQVVSAQTGVPYIRCKRPSPAGAAEGEAAGDVIVVEDCNAAVDYLQGMRGNVFVTTGSKELKCFTCLSHYEERVYARVLPVPEVLSECIALGIKGKHLIAMQGPFTREMNLAMLRMIEADFLVTKDSGQAGGLGEKIAAAEAAGCQVVLIKKPEEEGLSPNQVIELVHRILNN